MEKITVSAARQTDAVGKHVILRAWVRTRRDSKGGFSFIELNDGSCQGNVQVVAPGELANYDSVVKHLHTGASVVIEGQVKASPAKGQATEVHASKVELVGDVLDNQVVEIVAAQLGVAMGRAHFDHATIQLND